MKTKKNKKSGFTLVELMIVAAIVAILAAIIIPLLGSNMDRAVAADGQNLLGTAATAMKVYYAEHGTFPADFLAATIGATTAGELGRSKYFAAPTMGTATGLDAWSIEAQVSADKGGLAAGDTLTLNQAGTWGGTVATKLNLD
jgi:prepilin-type N-terminal cleavage/methylation domain-containing protein